MRLRRNAILLLVSVACAVTVAPPVVALGEGPQQPARPVYVVPDIGTYLYAISLWDNDVRFPIFIGESRFLDLFLNGYPGAEIKRLEPKQVGKIGQTLVYRALYAAWGPETLDDAPAKVSREDLKARLESLGIVPRGIVVTNVGDAEFAGGLALAAGHHQPLVFHTSQLKRSLATKVMEVSAPESAKEKLRKTVLELVEEWGYPYEGLGKGIDYITLALNMPHAYFHKRPDGTGSDPGYAMTDAIGRLTAVGTVHGTGSAARRSEPAVYAYCGQLIEAAPQMALFQAMSSLFTETDRALFFDRWYTIHGLEGVKGYQVLRTKVHTINRDQRERPQASLDQWHRLTDGVHRFDFIHLSAAGGATDWYDGTVDDIPEGGPCAVHFVQSGSAVNPAAPDTLAGRWLLNGAYVYYGAVIEPYATSFNTAQSVAQALVTGSTYGEAFERKATLPVKFREPWKLTYVGDPLARPRFVQDPDEPEWSRTWRHAVAVLRQADYRQAVLLMEGVFSKVPSGHVDELWRDLLRAYELTLGIGTLNVPDPKRFFTPTFIDGWMLPADVAEYRPEIGWRARLHMRMIKDADLSDLLATRLKLETLPDDLKKRLRGEIEALDTSATLAKMWLTLGPLEWADPDHVPRAFPAEVPGDMNHKYSGPDGAVHWVPKLVQPETFVFELSRPKAGADGLYLAVTFVRVPGSDTQEAVLKLTGSAAAAKPGPLVWLNRELVEPEPGSTARHVVLKPGGNEIVVRLAVRGDGDEPITLGMSLTDPEGKRSRHFGYVDLIEEVRRHGAPAQGER